MWWSKDKDNIDRRLEYLEEDIQKLRSRVNDCEFAGDKSTLLKSRLGLLAAVAEGRYKEPDWDDLFNKVNEVWRGSTPVVFGWDRFDNLIKARYLGNGIFRPVNSDIRVTREALPKYLTY